MMSLGSLVLPPLVKPLAPPRSLLAAAPLPGPGALLILSNLASTFAPFLDACRAAARIPLTLHHTPRLLPSTIDWRSAGRRPHARLDRREHLRRARFLPPDRRLRRRGCRYIGPQDWWKLHGWRLHSWRLRSRRRIHRPERPDLLLPWWRTGLPLTEFPRLARFARAFADHATLITSIAISSIITAASTFAAIAALSILSALAFVVHVDAPLRVAGHDAIRPRFRPRGRRYDRRKDRVCELLGTVAPAPPTPIAIVGLIAALIAYLITCPRADSAAHLVAILAILPVSAARALGDRRRSQGRGHLQWRRAPFAAFA